MKVKIITDTYFPEIMGGAEISLGHIVSGLKDKKDIKIEIIAQSESVSECIQQKKGNINIVRVPAIFHPNIRKIPLKGQSNDKIDVIIGNLHNSENVFLLKISYISMVIKKWMTYLFLKTNSKFSTKIALLISNFFSKLFLKSDIEYLEEDYSFFEKTDYLYNAIKKTDCDIVHCDNTRSIMRYIESGAKFPSVAVVRDLKFLCPRRVNISHSSKGPCLNCYYQCLEDFNYFHRYFIRKIFAANLNYRQKLLQKHNKIICISEFLKDSLKRVMAIEPVVIHNPVKIMDQSVNKKIDQLNTGNQKSIFFAGVLEYNKGPDIAIDIVYQLLMEQIDVKLIIAGKGRLFNFLKQKIKQLNIEKNVEITGFIAPDDLVKYYQLADLVICPTRWPEPFGRIPIEAMSFGKPVVTFKMGGFVETVVDGKTGFLVMPGNLTEFKEKVKILIQNEDLRKKMQKNCFEHVSANFTIEQKADQYYSVYERTITEIL